MKREIAELWMADLRSGKHKQARGSLETTEGFCCLGRLTRLFMLAEPGVLVAKPMAWKTHFVDFRNESSYSSLPSVVQRWAGMKSSQGAFPEGLCLSEMNDHGFTFPEIANVIEKHWERL